MTTSSESDDLETRGKDFMKVLVNFEPWKSVPYGEIAVPPSMHAWIRYHNTMSVSKESPYPVFEEECSRDQLNFTKGQF